MEHIIEKEIIFDLQSFFKKKKSNNTIEKKPNNTIEKNGPFFKHAEKKSKELLCMLKETRYHSEEGKCELRI